MTSIKKRQLTRLAALFNSRTDAGWMNEVLSLMKNHDMKLPEAYFTLEMMNGGGDIYEDADATYILFKVNEHEKRAFQLTRPYYLIIDDKDKGFFYGTGLTERSAKTIRKI